MDPLTKSYPMLTPYQFASNMPIAGVDLDGLEFTYYTAMPYLNNKGSVIEKVDEEYTRNVYSSVGNTTIKIGAIELGELHILRVGFDQFYFENFSDLYSAAQNIDWQHFDNTQEVVGDGLDPKKTLEHGQKFVDGYTGTVSMISNFFGLVSLRSGAGKNKTAIGADGSPQQVPSKVYRKARDNESQIKDLTRRPGEEHLSATEKLTSDIQFKGTGKNVYNTKKGAPFVEINVSKLPNGASDLILDGGLNGLPAGHISIKGSVTPQQIQTAITGAGKVPKVKNPQ